MNTLNSNESKIYPVFTWVLFGLLITYLLLRAYFLEPLHDEAATFFYYIESGLFWGPDVMLDANNHWLNSILGHWMYLIFGDQFFFVRLPNVFAFILFFWGIYRLIKPIQSDLNKMLILLGTTCIPFILDYFSYTRGYGLSMGLFIFSLSYVRDFVVHLHLRSAFWASFFMGLSVYANLNFILSLILMGLLFVLMQLLHKKELSIKQHLLLVSNYILLALAMLPNIFYGLQLKESGALYYGSLDGFWEVTGKTLSRYVIFYDADWLKYASLALIAVLIFYFVRRWKSLGGIKFFRKSSTLMAWFLFGNCAAIILMAKLMDVNYPEDRVGMYLVTLFLLMMGFVLNEIKAMNWMLVGMLFFPIVMIPKTNLSTSIFSPDDRMAQTFFDEVQKHVDSYSTISIYPMQQLTWAHHSRSVDSNNYVIVGREFNKVTDIAIHKTPLLEGIENLDEYDVIAHTPESTHIAYKRKSPYQKKVIYELPLTISETQKEFVSLVSFIIPDSLRNRKLQFHIHGDVEAENKFREFAIMTYSTFDENDQVVNHSYTNERWYHGKKKEFLLNFNYAVERLEPNEHEIRTYLWNRKHEKIGLKNGVFQILELIETKE